MPDRLSSPTVGFTPTRPLALEGEMMDPDVSVPIAAAQVARRRPHPGARAGARRLAVVRIGVVGLAAAPAPAAGGAGRAEVGPLAEVGLAEDDGAGLAQLPGDERVPRRLRAEQRERARRGFHLVGGGDVVLDEDRDAVQRPAHPSGVALLIHLVGDRAGVGVHLEHVIEVWPALVKIVNALGVLVHQAAGVGAAGGHLGLEVGDGHFLEREGRHRPRFPIPDSRFPAVQGDGGRWRRCARRTLDDP